MVANKQQQWWIIAVHDGGLWIMTGGHRLMVTDGSSMAFEGFYGDGQLMVKDGMGN